MRWLALLLLTGCSHVPLNQAITAHNVFRQMVSDASDGYSELYGAVASSNMSKSDAEYKAAMKPYDDVVTAINVCYQTEVALQHVLAQCVADNDDDCDTARIGFACAAVALDTLSTSYGQIRGGMPLYAAAAIAKAQLGELAHGAVCK